MLCHCRFEGFWLWSRERITFLAKDLPYGAIEVSIAGVWLAAELAKQMRAEEFFAMTSKIIEHLEAALAAFRDVAAGLPR